MSLLSLDKYIHLNVSIVVSVYEKFIRVHKEHCTKQVIEFWVPIGQLEYSCHGKSAVLEETETHPSLLVYVRTMYNNLPQTAKDKSNSRFDVPSQTRMRDLIKSQCDIIEQHVFNFVTCLFILIQCLLFVKGFAKC